MLRLEIRKKISGEEKFVKRIIFEIFKEKGQISSRFAPGKFILKYFSPL